LNSAAQNEGWAICNSGANLYFKIIGSGPPLVLIGDAGHSSEYLLDLANGLSASYRVIYFDPRSIGKSKSKWVSDSLVNFQRTVADIEGLRLVLRIPKWSVVAHGFGTNVAMVYAARYGQSVNQLVLINPELNANQNNLDQYDFPVSLQPSEITERFEGLKQKISQQNPEDSVARWRAISEFQAITYSADTLNTAFIADYLTEKTTNSKINNQIKRQPIRFSANLSNVRNPVTVLISKKRTDYYRAIGSIKNTKPDCRIVSIGNAHHFPWLDNPGVFYLEMRSVMGQTISNLAYKQQNESEKKTNRTHGSGYQRRKRA
jgi:pimeloyl-ACP methyl ester carboxylesterase